MKKMCSKKVRWIEELTKREVYGSESALIDIMKMYDEDDRSSRYLTYEYVDQNGKEQKREFSKFKFGKSDGFDYWNCVFPIRIVYEDGTSEYGLKWMSETCGEVDDMVLCPIYRRNGVVKDVVIGKKDSKKKEPLIGSVRSWTTHSNDAKTPLWVEHLIPYYTGSIDNKLLKGYTKKDIAHIRNCLYTDKYTSSAKFGEVDGKKMAYLVNAKAIDGSSVEYRLTDYELKNHLDNPETLRSAVNLKYYECEYIKSVYVRKYKQKIANHFIPLSDLFIISERDKMVWDNLTSTLSNRMK